ncbi:MAG: MBL fold metallo-hydrolase [Anaerolineae bacterium]|nr:MBL fold metallo-hydrolase [Anaerolineae bacterium]
MIIKTLTVGPILTNSYIVGDESSKEGMIIDPGGDGKRIVDEVRRLGLTIKYVVNTHGHFDHTLANSEVMTALKMLQDSPPALAIHPADATLLAVGGGAAWFGVQADPSPPPDLELNEGDVLTLGDIELEVWHTPGHSLGSVSLVCPAERVVFDGDVLFNAGIGRTDLPGGDYYTLMNSIKRLLTLPDETKVYSGHGPATTIGNERRSNPWL